jgi:hypothetical protein
MCRSSLIVAFSLVSLACSPLMPNQAFAQTDACAEGYVWREAFPDDHVCVTKETHDLVARKIETLKKTAKEAPVTNASQALFGVWQVRKIMSV